MYRIALIATLITGLAGIAGCATQTVSSDSAPPPATGELEVAPVLSVERFLAAANADDWESMGRIFGTMDGPFADVAGREEVEVRMNAIATILKHEDFAVVNQRRVPGRDRATVRLGVNLLIDGASVEDVGFMVVHSRRGPWLVEEIDLVKITSR